MTKLFPVEGWEGSIYRFHVTFRTFSEGRKGRQEVERMVHNPSIDPVVYQSQYQMKTHNHN